MQIVTTPNAPAAIGPYSQAVINGSLVFCSGQIALDPKSPQLVGSTAAEQTAQVLRNLRAILEAAGSGLDRVLKTTVFLKDMADFPAVNEVYGQSFGSHRPARATVQVARLPKDALVEIECVAERAVAD